jgi:hypothetical protein
MKASKKLPKGLAAHCPYSLDCYHTREFPPGVPALFRARDGTNDVAGCPGNSTVLPRLFRSETSGKAFSAPLLLAISDVLDKHMTTGRINQVTTNRARASQSEERPSPTSGKPERSGFWLLSGGPTETRPGSRKNRSAHASEGHVASSPRSSPLSIRPTSRNNIRTRAIKANPKRSRRPNRRASQQTDSSLGRRIGLPSWQSVGDTYSHRVCVQVSHQLTPAAQAQRRPRAPRKGGKLH